MAAQTAITIQGLTKRYDNQSVNALERLSLQVEAGEIYGFLGPNGAGKSTTIRLLMGFLRPTEGAASIGGFDCWDDGPAARRSVGYLSGDFVAYPKMTGRDLLTYLASLSGSVKRTSIDRLAKKFEAALDQPIGTLSKGNRQKIGIIQALMHTPKVLILDEPTSGLDPIMQEAFYDELADLRGKGAAVFMSSHNLSEAQKMCDRAGIIRTGKLVHEAAIRDLTLHATQTISVRFKNKPPLSALRALSNKQLIMEGKTVTVRMSGDLRPLFALLAKEPVEQITTHENDLEDEFMQFYEKDSAL